MAHQLRKHIERTKSVKKKIFMNNVYTKRGHKFNAHKESQNAGKRNGCMWGKREHNKAI
jgi:hypothetical protein